MLSLLKIKNVALIDRLDIEFGPGLNLLTGETGSGKSIIVDTLSALTGERVSSDLIKEGEQTAVIEGLFTTTVTPELKAAFDESGFDTDGGAEIDVIVRREISLAGKNRVFVNDQLVTAAFLKRIGPFLVDIHGQGEHADLFDPGRQREMLDQFARADAALERTAAAFSEWRRTRGDLDLLRQDEAEKLQLLDILAFQVDELRQAALSDGEADELEEEKRRLNNVEKLSALSAEAYSSLYESNSSTVATLGQTFQRIRELGEYDARFREYFASFETATAVLEDAAIALRDFRNHLEFSPERLEEVESRLAEISRVTRKYGGTAAAALEHLASAEKRLQDIESAELKENELRAELERNKANYAAASSELSDLRHASSKAFEKAVSKGLKDVALEKARFEVRIRTEKNDESWFGPRGFDRLEFFFSANPGESPKSISKVASGGEASRLMLILKTAADPHNDGKTAVFDEIDAGIGGRVAEAVGQKLKQLAKTQQVLCVTHQAQVASKADRHFAVEKTTARNSTEIAVRELGEAERIEEIARMLAGEKITEAARENAREMLAAAA